MTILVVLLAPVGVLAALAVRFAYDDWCERRALRSETDRVADLRRAAKRRLVGLEGGTDQPSGADDERPHKTA